LDYITLKALEKEPSRRYPSVDQLARDVRRYLGNLPVLARGRTTAYLVSRLVRRHRVAVATGALVLVALLAGSPPRPGRRTSPASSATRAKRRFQDVKALAHAVIFDIHDSIVSLPGATRAREILVQHALRYLDDLSKEAGDDPSLLNELGVAYGKIGDVQGRPEFSNLGRTADALHSYQRSLELLEGASRGAPDSVEFARNLVLTMQRLGDLRNQMGQKEEAMRLAQEGKRRILALASRYPENELPAGRLRRRLRPHQRHAVGRGRYRRGPPGTAGGIAWRREAGPGGPQEAQRRRSRMVSHAKTAYLRALTGDRTGAATDYERSQELALELVRDQPNNTDATRDLGVVYGMRAMFLADGGAIDSALALYERSMRISEDMAAADPSDVLQQVDLAKGRAEIGSILMKGRRYPEAEDRFRDAYQSYSRLAAKDSSNAALRGQMARTSRDAGDACRAMAERSGAAGERALWRSRAADWYSKSLALYRSLSSAGALSGSEAGAPEQVSSLLASVR
jgi:tetratricopeptide (TPR) repeat protein